MFSIKLYKAIYSLNFKMWPTNAVFLNFILVQKAVWCDLINLSYGWENNQKYQAIWFSTKEAIWTEGFLCLYGFLQNSSLGFH